MVERILESYAIAYGLRFIGLRYFNAAGATKTLGEQHEPETHLIPLILQTASSLRDPISVFGDNYPTKDGTAERDYIHVSDLSKAHILALDYLQNGGESDFINLGNGRGYSVKKIIAAAEKVTGKKIKTQILPARAGDSTRLIANAEKAHKVLNWKPQISDIEDIIESAWIWFNKNSKNPV